MKIFPSSSLIAMQNFVAVCHTVHVGACRNPKYLGYAAWGPHTCRDVTRLGLGAQTPQRTSQPSQTRTVIGIFARLFWTSCCCRLIEDYLFVVFCVVDMTVISLSTTCNQ